MPSVGEIPASKVRVMCEELERLLKPPILSDEERALLHGHDVEVSERTKDDWWKRYCEVRSYARRKEKRVVGRPAAGEIVDESPLFACISNQPFVVRLSTGTKEVVPASVARTAIVEDLDFWIKQLTVWHYVIQTDADNFDDPGDLLKRVNDELLWTRRMLYTQVCAPTPAPVVCEDPEDWTELLTPGDELVLLNAWLEVNVRRLQQAEAVIKQKYPTRDDGENDTTPGSMTGFPFMMVGVAYREKVAPEYVMRERSIAEVMSTYAARAQESAHSKEKSDKKAEAKRQREEMRKNVGARAKRK